MVLESLHYTHHHLFRPVSDPVLQGTSTKPPNSLAHQELLQFVVSLRLKSMFASGLKCTATVLAVPEHNRETSQSLILQLWQQAPFRQHLELGHLKRISIILILHLLGVKPVLQEAKGISVDILEPH